MQRRDTTIDILYARSISASEAQVTAAIFDSNDWQRRIVGRTLSFSWDGQSTSDVSDADGLVSFVAPLAAGQQIEITASFAGDNIYKPTSVVEQIETGAALPSPDNLGTEFCLAFMANGFGYGTSQYLLLTGPTETTATVEIPGLGYSSTHQISPLQITTVPLPDDVEMSYSRDNVIVVEKGILVTAPEPIAVYGLNQKYASTDAFLGLPADMLGEEYLAVDYPDKSLSPYGPPEMAIVGTADGTEVTITTPRGDSVILTLDRLEVIQFQQDYDQNGTIEFIGTEVQSSAPVAFFSGNACAAYQGVCDHVQEQLPPVSSWGDNSLTVPLENQYYYQGWEAITTYHELHAVTILAAYDGTTVTINDELVATIDRGQYHTAEIERAYTEISTSQPALVMQSSNEWVCYSQPFMMMITPNDQFATEYTVTTMLASSTKFDENYLNIVVRSTKVSGLRLNGLPIAVTFTPIGGSGFSGAYVPVSPGTHYINHLSPDVAFGVYSYGWHYDNCESYGYPAGLRLPTDPAPDLQLTKSDGVDTAQAGELLTYTMTTNNAGTQDATGVILTDNLPENTTFVEASDGGGETGGVVTWPTFELAAGDSTTRTVTVQVDGALPIGVIEITNTAEVSDDGANGPDPTPEDNTASDTTEIVVTNGPPELDPVDDPVLDENTTLNVAISATDPDGDAISLSATGLPTFAALTDNSDGTGTLSLTPGYDDAGVYPDVAISASDGALTDTAFVTITVLNVNGAPVADDQSLSTDEDTALDITLTGSDVDGDALAFAIVAGVTNGTLSGTPPQMTYTPNADYYGADSFTFGANDGTADSNVATVTIVVNPVNDAPVASDDTATTDEDTAITIDVLTNDNDVDGDILTVSSVTQAINGTVVNNGTDVSYTPDADYCGGDSCTYTASDGNGGTDTTSVSVTVTCVNDIPVASDDAATTDEDTAITIDVLANDSDVDGETLTVGSVTQPANGTVVNNGIDITYTPDADYCGGDSFTYSASDGNGGTDTASVSLTITCVNDAPVAVDDAYTTDEDSPLTIPAPGMLGNDYDVDGDAVVVLDYDDSGTLGLVTVNPDGSLTYDPNGAFESLTTGETASDSLTYTVSDGNGATDSALVAITINGVNDAPAVSVDISALAAQYSDAITPVKITTTDVDAASLAITAQGLPSGLTLTPQACTGSKPVNCSATITGTPDVMSGMYIIDIYASDGVLTDNAQIVLTVAPEDGQVAVDEDNAVAVQVAEAGGNSDEFSLTVYVSEAQPDEPAVWGRPGDVSLAEVSLSLVPVGPGGPIDGLCTPGAVTGSGYDALLPVTCSFSDVPVNTYTAQVTVSGGYYRGDGEDVLVVFDPSLGFATGGGWFYWPGSSDPVTGYPGDKTNFGFTMKYGKNGRNVKGNLLLIRHLPDGSIYRVKSNALYGLAVGENPSVPMGWASFSGKATYLEPGWPEPIGNHEFLVYVEDRDEPGTGVDRFWVEVKDKDRVVVPVMSMAREATENAVQLSGGNIAVPHTPAAQSNEW